MKQLFLWHRMNCYYWKYSTYFNKDENTEEVEDFSYVLKHWNQWSSEYLNEKNKEMIIEISPIDETNFDIYTNYFSTTTSVFKCY